MKLPHIPKKFKKFFSFKEWMFFWYRHYKGMFFVGFLAVVALGSFFWYRNLYQYHWSDERKQAFLEQHFKETVFQEKAFRDTVYHLQERSRIHDATPNLTREIFLSNAEKQ
ncbi:MAG: hypothetical protein Q8O53_01830 [Candidatus Moranbacteria bacterium]|nr:hypothetical protein [Candidatus Moranbacteria bacterium]